MHTAMKSACARAARGMGVMAAAMLVCGGAVSAQDLPGIGGYTTRVYAEIPWMTPWGLAFDAQKAAIVTEGCEAACGECTPMLTRLDACDPSVARTLSMFDYFSNCQDHVVVVDETGSVSGVPGAMIVSTYMETGPGHGSAAISVYAPEPLGVLWTEGNVRVRGMAIDGDGRLVFSVDDSSWMGSILRMTDTLAVEQVANVYGGAGTLAIDEISQDIYIGCRDGLVRAYAAVGGAVVFQSDWPMKPFPPLVSVPEAVMAMPGVFENVRVCVIDEENETLIVPTDLPFSLLLGQGFDSHYGSAMFGPGGALYVVDSDNRRVLQFSPEGTGPVITRQPVGQTACIDQVVRFTIDVQSAATPSPTVMWYKKGTPDVLVEVDDALEIRAAFGKFGKYYAVVTDCQGGRTVSREFELRFGRCTGGGGPGGSSAVHVIGLPWLW